MIVRVLFFLGVVSAITYFILRKKGIHVRLTPLGKTVLARIFMKTVQLVLRRFGL